MPSDAQERADLFKSCFSFDFGQGCDHLQSEFMVLGPGGGQLLLLLLKALLSFLAGVLQTL